MKLFYTQRSPFARKIRMLARLTGQDGDIEELETTVRDPDAVVLPHNPTGKVPTLVLDDGTALSESLLITSYLEERAGDRALNGTGPEKWKAYGFDAFVTATTDNLAWRFRETTLKEADKQSPSFLTLETDRARRNFDALAAAVDTDLADPVRTGHLSAAALLAFVDAFMDGSEWRGGRPGLVSWYEAFRQQPAFVATEPKTG